MTGPNKGRTYRQVQKAEQSSAIIFDLEMAFRWIFFYGKWEPKTVLFEKWAPWPPVLRRP